MNLALKKAVLWTGAAARISQEVALFDQLRAQKGLTISPSDTLLAGFSSGSLNVTAANACFRLEQPMDWDAFYKKQVLFPLKTKDVFSYKFLLPLDTSPLRQTVNTFLTNIQYQYVKDLSFQTYILTFSWRELETLWACSQEPQQAPIYLSDLLMCSTAIPILFPSQEIHCIPGQKSDFPGGKFADGGTGGAFKKFEKYLGGYVENHGPFDTLYIISPMRERNEEETSGLKDSIDKLLGQKVNTAHLDDQFMNINFHVFLKFLERLAQWNYKGKPMAKEIVVCIPKLEKNFGILDFDQQEAQYNAVSQWAIDHPSQLAVPLETFLNEHTDDL